MLSASIPPTCKLTTAPLLPARTSAPAADANSSISPTPHNSAIKPLSFARCSKPPASRCPNFRSTHPQPLAYRNRIRLTLAEVDGQFRAGYMRSLFEHGAGHSTARPGSTERNDLSDVFLEDGETMDPVSIPIGIQSVSIPSSISFLPIRECPIAAPILWRATDAFLASTQRTTPPMAAQPPANARPTRTLHHRR